MRVHWTDNAVEHLVNIYEYIALNSNSTKLLKEVLKRLEGFEKMVQLDLKTI